MTQTRLSIVGAALLLLVAGGPAPAPVLAQSGDETEIPAPAGEEAATDVVGGATLYQRLGGYDVIAGSVDDFLRRMGEHERLRRFLEGASEEDLRRVRQNTVDFLCQETGGPCFYTGKDMDEAHEGKGVSAEDWDEASELMAVTLDAQGITGELREEFGGFIAGLRDAVVDEE